MKPKIAVIGLKGLPAFVGAGTVGENIIEQLSDSFDFYVYATSSHTKHGSGPLNGYYQKVFKALSNKKLNAVWYYLRSALHARFKGDYDLIHIHNSFAGFLIPILKGKYPIVLTTHGAFLLREKWKKFEWFFMFNTNHLVSKADYLCCVSKDEKRQFRERLNLNAHYIPNGINPVDKESLPRVGINEPYLFFGSGRIIPTKGLHDLLNALHKIGYKGKLMVAGDLEQMPSYKAKLLALVGDLNVEFIGLIKDKPLLYSYIMHSDLLVFPSYMEGMSMMLLEAVAVDCPIVCSNIIPNTDVLNEKETLFFRKGDVDDLAEKISWAFSHPEEMKTLSKNAKKKFLKAYSWKTIASQYAEVFHKTIEARK